MKRTPLNALPFSLPTEWEKYTEGAALYNSSCSPEATVIYIDSGNGLYLKRAEAGTLRKEAEMDTFFHGKGLGARVVEYLTDDCDLLLTERVKGEDCTFSDYISDPKRLCDTLATCLRELHETDGCGCPVTDRCADYFRTVEKNRTLGLFDSSYIDKEFCSLTADEAYSLVTQGKKLLKSDTLIHGDYCLPNVMLDNWALSGYIDLGGGGIGDRHIDLFWGAWTLNFNLKTDAYRERFFDAYGRDKIDREALKVVSLCEAFG